MSAPRGFAPDEYRARVEAAQALMAKAGLGALLLTTEPEVQYFSGFLTRFWLSPTRPWFLVLPASGAPVAVIPEIGAPLMGRTWLRDIRTWPAPRPADDGVSLLADTLREVSGGGPVGVPSGPETHLRMPLDDYRKLHDAGLTLVADAGITARLRMVKSPAEIERIRAICACAGRAFDRVGEVAGAGVTVERVFRNFQRLLLEEGADWVPYLAGAAGPDGYADVISPADDAPMRRGDVLMLDTGALRDGYYCDFDRNFAIGTPTPAAAEGHARLWEAAAAGLEAARAGMRACDLWQVMADVTGAQPGTGRLGHGLGLQLTEGPSLAAHDETLLQEGMVLTLEPVVATGPGRLMVLEEVIVLEGAGCHLLTPRASEALPVV